MTYMKILSGHSSAKWIRYYLFKNDRAIDKDFLNLTDRDWKGRDWAKVMDRTRESFRQRRSRQKGHQGPHLRALHHLVGRKGWRR